MHWPNGLGLIEGFCMVCEQPWVDLNPQPFALKATALTTAPRKPYMYLLIERIENKRGTSWRREALIGPGLYHLSLLNPQKERKRTSAKKKRGRIKQKGEKEKGNQ